MTWAQYVKQKTEECPHRVLPRKANSLNIQSESINRSESISAKIEKINPRPSTELARRIYERMKKQQDVNIEQAAAHARIELAQDKNKEKAENKKKRVKVAKKKY